MLMGFEIAGRGMNTLQEIYGNISNNIANAQTLGFKKARVEVENLFPVILDEAMAEDAANQVVPGSSVRKKFELGTGSHVVDLTRDFTQGTIQTTTEQFDLAIMGEGFFRLRKPDGTIVYSRAGDFFKDSTGRLVKNGGLILDPQLTIPNNALEVSIDQNGVVKAQMPNESVLRELGQIMIARFNDPSKLMPIGNNCYTKTAAAGNPEVESPGVGTAGSIVQYSLETSNVNVVDEMMKLVINQRNFQVASKAFQVTDAIIKAGIV